MTPRLRVAVLAGGRSSEHEISLASARSVVEALDPDRYETRTIEIGRDGAWALPPAPGAPALAEAPREPADPDGSRSAGARRRRRRPADPARAVRRGRHGAGPARARRRPVRRLGRDRVRALHGQGSLQGRASRPRDPRRRERHAPHRATRSRTPSATRCSSSRRGSARRSGSRRPRRPRSSTTAVALARRHDDKVLVEEFQPGVEVEVGVLGNRDPVASVVGEIVAHADWYDFDAKYADGGMDLIVPARLPAETHGAGAASSRSRRSSRPTARGWRASTSSSARTGGRRQRAQHDPGLHRDERLREAVRRERDPVRRAARPARRARARAPRAAAALEY